MELGGCVRSAVDRALFESRWRAVQRHFLWHSDAYARSVAAAEEVGHQFGHWQQYNGAADFGVPGAVGRQIGRGFGLAIHSGVVTVAVGPVHIDHS